MMSETAYTFGDNPPYRAERWYTPDYHSDIKVDRIILEPPAISTDAYHQNLDDINRSFRTITDKKTGKQFEVAVANAGAPADDGIDAELSTFTSSISGNPGNAVELAENAALHPDRQRLYIASFGNGGSSYWDTDEQKHIRQTGRFVRPTGEALPTVQALARALKAADYIITRFSTNSAGGAHATALMSALPEGQVSHAYLKSRPNVSNHDPGLLWGLGILINDIRDDKKFEAESHDSWKLTPEMVKAAKTHMPEIYKSGRAKDLRRKAGGSHKISKMLTDLQAFSNGGADKNYPAQYDTRAAMQRQPDAKITLHFPVQDSLYNHIPLEVVEFINVLRGVGVAAIGNLDALVMPGRHRDHTKYPRLRWSAENYTFSRQ